MARRKTLTRVRNTALTVIVGPVVVAGVWLLSRQDPYPVSVWVLLHDWVDALQTAAASEAPEQNS